MPDMRLYSVRIPSDAQMQAQSQTRRNQAAQGLLDAAGGSVKSLSLDPNEKQLRGQFRAEYAELMAAELEELFSADGVTVVPYYGVSTDTPEDGYYTLKQVNRQPVDPREPRLQQFDGVLTNAGGWQTDFRGVRTNPSQVENDFGNQQTAYVGIPATATDVHWYDEEAETTEPASVAATRTGEFGNLEVYDAKASSYGTPVLIYDLPYSEVGKRDVKLWDDYGRSKFDGDGINRWQKVFLTDHTFRGKPWLENTLVRLSFDESTPSLSAETWDTGASAWSSVSLGTSNWSFDAVEFVRLGDERARAQCRFVNSGHSKSPFHLDLRLRRGYQYPQWTVAANEQGPTPSGLVDLLSPVADGQDYSAQSEQGLVARQEVRK